MQIVEEINLETNNQYTYSKKAEKRNAGSAFLRFSQFSLIKHITVLS